MPKRTPNRETNNEFEVRLLFKSFGKPDKCEAELRRTFDRVLELDFGGGGELVDVKIVHGPARSAG